MEISRDFLADMALLRCFPPVTLWIEEVLVLEKILKTAHVEQKGPILRKPEQNESDWGSDCPEAIGHVLVKPATRPRILVYRIRPPT